MARTIGLLVVALGWAAVPLGARATEYPRALQLAQGTQTADTGSHIELTKIVVLRYLPKFDPRDADSSTPVDIGCVRFVNHDSRTANHVVVRFSYDTVPPVNPPMSWTSTVRTCRAIQGFEWGGDGMRHALYGRQTVTIAASVREVDSNDGTSWRNPDPPRSETSR